MRNCRIKNTAHYGVVNGNVPMPSLFGIGHLRCALFIYTPKNNKHVSNNQN